MCFPITRMNSGMDDVHWTRYCDLSGVLSLAESLISLPDLWVTGAKYGSTVTDHGACIPSGRLDFDGLINYPAINRVGQCVHNFGIEISNEQSRVSALQTNVAHG